MKPPYAIVKAAGRTLTIGGDGTLNVTGGSDALNAALTSAVELAMRDYTPAAGFPIAICAAEVARIVKGKIAELKDVKYPPDAIF